MPIASGLSTLQILIKSALSLKEGASIDSTSQLIASAISSIVPMGLFPVSPVPIPLSPSGISAGQVQIKTGLNLKEGASIDSVSVLLANGISLIAPTAPPTGLSTLITQIKSALSLKEGANIDSVSALLSSAIIIYYQSGGVT